MKEFAVYTAARLGLFLATYAVVVGVYLLVTGSGQVPLLWPFVLAAVISAVASIYLLRGMRERFALAVERRAGRASQRLEQIRSKEDSDEVDG